MDNKIDITDLRTIKGKMQFTKFSNGRVHIEKMPIDKEHISIVLNEYDAEELRRFLCESIVTVA